MRTAAVHTLCTLLETMTAQCTDEVVPQQQAAGTNTCTFCPVTGAAVRSLG